MHAQLSGFRTGGSLMGLLPLRNTSRYDGTRPGGSSCVCAGAAASLVSSFGCSSWCGSSAVDAVSAATALASGIRCSASCVVTAAMWEAINVIW